MLGQKPKAKAKAVQPSSPPPPRQLLLRDLKVATNAFMAAGTKANYDAMVEAQCKIADFEDGFLRSAGFRRKQFPDNWTFERIVHFIETWGPAYGDVLMDQA